MTRYWRDAADKYNSIAPLLEKAIVNFERELFLVIWLVFNEGWAKDGTLIKSSGEDFFVPERDLPFHVPEALEVLPTIEEIFSNPDKALMVLRDHPILRFKNGSVGVVEPDHLITRCADRVYRRTITNAAAKSKRERYSFRRFFGELHEMHVKAIARECIPVVKKNSPVIVYPTFVDEFNMSEDLSKEILSPDCFLVGISRIALEAKYRSLWDLDADMMDWFWRSVSHTSGRHLPRQLVNFLEAWQREQPTVLNKLGRISDGGAFYFFSVLDDAASWMNSSDFKAHVLQKYPDSDINLLQKMFFINIDSLEALSVAQDSARVAGSGITSVQILRDYAEYVSQQPMISSNTEDLVLNLTEFILREEYILPGSSSGPQFMQDAFDECWETLLGHAFEPEELIESD